MKSSDRDKQNMKRTVFALAFFSLTLPAFGQGVDPLIGTWKLNLEKSKSTEPLPKSQIATWAGEGQNFAVTVNGVDAKGQPFKFVFKHIYDGMPHPQTGAANADTSAYARIGNTINIVRFKNGKPVNVSQGLIVPGKTYTVTEDYEENGQLHHGVLVFDRQ
jgi:hypothetical protein